MIREFVDAVDLKALGFKERKSEEGRPSYSASLLLKVWLCGYVTKIRSSRGLERACMDQVTMLWLTGMHRPDHTTLWRFWRDNQDAIRQVFRQLVKMATRANLVGLVLHAVDGTKILSQASDRKAWHRLKLEAKLGQLNQAIDEVMKQTQQAEKAETGEYRLPEELQQRQQLRELIQSQLKQMEEEERDHLNPGDGEARMMKCGSRTEFAYNAQAVVDEQSGLIVAADVVTDESDNYQLTAMLDQVQENVGQVAEETVADAGYFAGSELAQAEDKGYSVLVNMPSEPEGDYNASRFVYDETKDQCRCPRGEILTFETTKRRYKRRPYDARLYRCQSYETCPVRWQCSQDRKGRTVAIPPHYRALVNQRQKQQQESKRLALKKRGKTVEPVFGWGKEVMGLRRWSVRGRMKVRTQWALLCTAMNLRRLHVNWTAGKLRFCT
jgi:transposase